VQQKILGKLKQFVRLFAFWTRDVPACIINVLTTTLPRVPFLSKDKFNCELLTYALHEVSIVLLDNRWAGIIHETVAMSSLDHTLSSFNREIIWCRRNYDFLCLDAFTVFIENYTVHELSSS
jgi:hypothetical protein